MTLNINSNADANLARQDNIESSSFNREEVENPVSTNTHETASSSNGGYHTYELGINSVMYPDTKPKSFDEAIHKIYYKRSNMRTTNHVRMVEENAYDYVELVKSIVVNAIEELNGDLVTIRSRLSYFRRFLDNVYERFWRVTEYKRAYETTDVFVFILNELNVFIHDLYNKYVLKGA